MNKKGWMASPSRPWPRLENDAVTRGAEEPWGNLRSRLGCLEPSVLKSRSLTLSSTASRESTLSDCIATVQSSRPTVSCAMTRSTVPSRADA